MDHTEEFQPDGGAHRKILIIDDNEINRAVLMNIFDGKYKTEEAENGKEGLLKLTLEKSDICAVLLDVVMPGMDGIEVMRRIKQMGLESVIPVFLITAENSDKVVREAYSLGVMDVISKPVVPYIVERRINSVIELFEARKRLGSKVEEQAVEILRQATQIIDLSRGMIEALAAAIEFRSGESGEHVIRIHDITRFMLENTDLGRGLSKNTIDQIALAAIMHDVGKIAVPDAILNKPGKLTSEEFDIMKTHTVQGGLLLEKIPQMRELEAFKYAYDIARHHHERWDGRGYPDGLKGGEIEIWTQIVSLADVYDALVSKRIYKEEFGADRAVSMIKNGECGQFNPMLLDRFFNVENDIRKLYTKDGFLNDK